MKIKDKISPMTKFGNIDPGTCFRFTNRTVISMKTDEDTYVDLVDGMLGECNLFDDISIVNGTFVEE